jgi:hypothetical protein
MPCILVLSLSTAGCINKGRRFNLSFLCITYHSVYYRPTLQVLDRGVANATEVVIGGGSAGALSVYLTADYYRYGVRVLTGNYTRGWH